MNETAERTAPGGTPMVRSTTHSDCRSCGSALYVVCASVPYLVHGDLDDPRLLSCAGIRLA